MFLDAVFIGGLGWLIGWLLRTKLLLSKGGLGTGAALGLCAIVWTVTVLIVATFLQGKRDYLMEGLINRALEEQSQRHPSWVPPDRPVIRHGINTPLAGSSASFLAFGIFWGIRRRKPLSNAGNTQRSFSATPAGSSDSMEEINHSEHKGSGVMEKDEEQFYAIAAQEIASKTMVSGIAAKAFSDALGDDKKTLALYIKLRVESLRDEHRREMDRRCQDAKAKAEETQKDEKAKQLRDQQEIQKKEISKRTCRKCGTVAHDRTMLGLSVTFGGLALFAWLPLKWMPDGHRHPLLTIALLLAPLLAGLLIMMSKPRRCSKCRTPLKLQPAPVNPIMTGPYRRWVTLIPSLLLPGSAQFLSGRRLAGVAWSACYLLSMILIIICLIHPNTPYSINSPGAYNWVLLVLQIIIAVDGLRQPIPRMRFKGWIQFVFVWFGIMLLPLLVTRTFFIRPFRIPTGAMQPTLMGNRESPDGAKIQGDGIFVNLFAYHFSEPQRGDVVVFKTDNLPLVQQNTTYIKRIAGLPGEAVSIVPPNLIVNGNKITEPRIFRLIAEGQVGFSGFRLAPDGFVYPLASPRTLRSDEYLVLGDNTSNSLDGRYFGPIKRDAILGKAFYIYAPANRKRRIE